jgi:hypothetical protein
MFDMLSKEDADKAKEFLKKTLIAEFEKANKERYRRLEAAEREYTIKLAELYDRAVKAGIIQDGDPAPWGTNRA